MCVRARLSALTGQVSYAAALERERRQAVIVERVVWIALALFGLALLRLARALQNVFL